jgi:CobQ-like glutamine amidotransferase family enzyme
VYLYPGLLGRYGHQGDALVLCQRCLARGVDAELITVAPGDAVPQQADLYLLAAGESAGLLTLSVLLQQQRHLLKAVDRGAVLFAVGVALPLLGTCLISHTGEMIAGLGVLDFESRLVRERRFGPVVGDPLLPIDGPLLGFEDHHLSVRLGAGLCPLASLRLGAGQGGEQHREGVWRHHVVGTSLRGPVLALNPALADWLLSQLLGPLPPLPMLAVDRLRERFLCGLPPRIGSTARRCIHANADSAGWRDCWFPVWREGHRRWSAGAAFG